MVGSRRLRMGKTVGASQCRLQSKVVTCWIRSVRLGERPKLARRSFLGMKARHFCESLLQIEWKCRKGRFFLTICLHIQIQGEQHHETHSTQPYVFHHVFRWCLPSGSDDNSGMYPSRRATSADCPPRKGCENRGSD